MNKKWIWLGGVAVVLLALSRSKAFHDFWTPTPAGANLDADMLEPQQQLLSGAQAANSSEDTYSNSSLRQVASLYPAFEHSYGSPTALLEGYGSGVRAKVA